jgi:hypothetical protein
VHWSPATVSAASTPITDETRNQTRHSLDALVRSLTERSIAECRRFQATERLGELPGQYRGPGCDNSARHTMA